MLDSYKCHISDDAKSQMKRGNTLSAVNPGGCTPKLQQPDVSINRPFKSVLRNQWEQYMLEWFTNNAAENPRQLTNKSSLTQSYQPLQHKLAVVRTLSHRADTIISTEEDNKEENRDITSTLRENGQLTGQCNQSVAVPYMYIKGVAKKTENSQIHCCKIASLSNYED